ncbi:DUF3152 domain-containing protein [Streptomyces sp. NPDC003691]
MGRHSRKGPAPKASSRTGRTGTGPEGPESGPAAPDHGTHPAAAQAAPGAAGPGPGTAPAAGARPSGGYGPGGHPAQGGYDSGGRSAAGYGGHPGGGYGQGGHPAPGHHPAGHQQAAHQAAAHQQAAHHPGGYGTGAQGFPPAGAPGPAVPGGRTSAPYGTGTGTEHAATGYGVPQARGGHPEQREPGGGWGTGTGPAVPPYAGSGGHPYPGAALPPHAGPAGPGGQPHPGGPGQPPRPSGPSGHSGPVNPAGPAPAGSRIPGPRREFVDAFDPSAAAALGAAAGHGPGGVPGNGPGSGTVPRPGDPGDTAALPAVDPSGGRSRDEDPAAVPDQRAPLTGSKSRTVTGIAAAAVTTVLAIIVAGQVATENERREDTGTTNDERAEDTGAASRSDSRRTPPQPALRDTKPQAPTYDQLMATRFPIDREFTGDGTFAAVPGLEQAPGKGRKIRYRVDVEKGLKMDGLLFATAVHRTLNDRRSWAAGGELAFERISSGDPAFVITLASPGTTDVWCAKSGLNTSIDKVSCDSASTSRVMINAYRWGLGSDTYGPDAMFAYRQMLINHEVGHRLGHGHKSCRTEGAPAPVMQQQTKSLNIDGIRCKANPWVHPKG